MIHYEIKIKKKKKKELPDQKQASNGAILSADNRASRSKNELPTELFLALPTKLLDRRMSFQIESLLWMLISMLRPDRCCGCRFWRSGQIGRKLWMPTIAAMRRTRAWWSFSACDRRSTPMISRLGLAGVDVWVTDGRRTKKKEYWIGRKQKEEERKKEK